MIATGVFLLLVLMFTFAVGRSSIPRCARAPLRTYTARDVRELAVLGASRFGELSRRYSAREPGGRTF